MLLVEVSFCGFYYRREMFCNIYSINSWPRYEFLFLMAFRYVYFTGPNKEACRKCMIYFLFDICSKLLTIFSPSEVGMYFVSPSEVTDWIFHKVVALSRSPWRIICTLWCMLQCFLSNVDTESLLHSLLIDS